ncbi:hypothetical protein Pfo_000344 [Paulownia fortunei]|nr:hypothetical protein Pfo_000344 [Paulownia fortunei]
MNGIDWMRISRVANLGQRIQKDGGEGKRRRISSRSTNQPSISFEGHSCLLLDSKFKQAASVLYAMRSKHLEALELEQKSKVPGKMRACGHDVHFVTLLGAAKMLQDHQCDLELSSSSCHQIRSCFGREWVYSV